MLSDKRYFEQRAAEETTRAERAPGAEEKSWHLELAEKFNRLARELDQAGPVPPTLRTDELRRSAAG
jgi:hypothetical protein